MGLEWIPKKSAYKGDTILVYDNIFVYNLQPELLQIMILGLVCRKTAAQECKMWGAIIYTPPHQKKERKKRRKDAVGLEGVQALVSFREEEFDQF